MGCCTDRMYVTRVNIAHNRLSGTLLPLAGTARLLSFDATNNSFEGGFPAQFGRSASLQRLRLGSNKLSGPIPLSLGGITSLTLLNVSDNALTCGMPGTLAQCRQLGLVVLRRNRLSGPVPD
jgi:Leucine-rich repeat (LRR) protein